MGVLPLQFEDGESADSLGLDGSEKFDINLSDDLKPQQKVKVITENGRGEKITFNTICRIDTPVEIDYYRHGGILHYVLREYHKTAKKSKV
jgi:aconitate hydratase